MDCPACKTESLSMTARQGITIDYCPRCRGVWLDRGELDKVIKRSAVELASVTRAALPPGAMSPQPAAECGHGGQHIYRADRQDGAHHRKSSWKELVD